MTPSEPVPALNPGAANGVSPAPDLLAAPGEPAVVLELLP